MRLQDASVHTHMYVCCLHVRARAFHSARASFAQKRIARPDECRISCGPTGQPSAVRVRARGTRPNNALRLTPPGRASRGLCSSPQRRRERLSVSAQSRPEIREDDRNATHQVAAECHFGQVGESE